MAGKKGRFVLTSRELNEQIAVRGVLAGRRFAAIESASVVSASSFAKRQKRIPDLLRNFGPGDPGENIQANDTVRQRY